MSSGKPRCKKYSNFSVFQKLTENKKSEKQKKQILSIPQLLQPYKRMWTANFYSQHFKAKNLREVQSQTLSKSWISQRRH